MTNMGYELKKYSSKNLKSLIELLNESFSLENKDQIGLVNWKYFDSFLENKTITYIALEKNQVVSHYTNIPVSISLDKKIFNSLICTDMATRHGYRGQGLISQLSAKIYAEVQQRDFDFSIGFSNDEGVKVDKYAGNYGYKVVGKFVRYFKVVLTRKKIAVKLAKINTFDDSLFNRSSEFLKIRKDIAYLNWRYFKKPNSEYECYQILEADKAIGYVVLRFTYKKCYVYDIVSMQDDKKSMITILRSIENEALDHGVRLVIYNVLDNKYWQSLFNTFKYFKKVNNHVNYYLTIKLHKESLDKDFLLSKDNWLLMNGDIL